MGYWVEGRVEGTIRLDFTVEFMVKGFHSHTHGDEFFLDYLQHSEDLHEVVTVEGGDCEDDIPHEWTTNGWKVREACLLREDEHTPGEWEEGGHGADYKVVIEFEGVGPFPFVLEEWNAKLSCADAEIACAISKQGREIICALERNFRRPGRFIRSVSHVQVDGEFAGTGEDGEKFEGVSLSGEVVDPHDLWNVRFDLPLVLTLFDGGA
jgi:hypothetical protein